MKIVLPRPARRQRGFTLVEMIGVLAIIAVLAGMLVPRVFSAINDSRINSAVMSYNSVKSAAMLYFGKYGRFGINGGGAITLATHTNEAANWDKYVLVPEGLVEKPFAVKVGTGSSIQVVATTTSATAATASNAAYDFDGSATAPSLANEASGGQFVLQCVLTGVANDDALALNKAVDGTDSALGESSAGLDTKGRCKYDVTAGTGSVYIYIAHK